MEPSKTDKMVALDKSLLQDLILEALNNKDQREREYAQTHYKRYQETWKTIQRYVKPPATILEIGPLMGHISIGLAITGYRVKTVDIPSETILYHYRLVTYGITECPCDLNREPLPMQEEQFDMVILAEVLEHLAYSSTQHAINEISRVLKPGGYLFLSTPNLFNLGARLRLLFGRQPIAREHMREYSPEELHKIIDGENLFRASGGIPVSDKIEAHLEIVEEWFSLSVDSVFKGKNRFIRMLLYPVKLLYPKFRTTVFIVARKK